ncbi:CheR family methyltransferase [Aureimonas pseudogalii]|uniref:Chemotaxis protein methyltransferase n=1 Tax=Aureimonas pseudogalii TaxID=1744844 RepID=A0A7W6H6V4_9HYPH|nr:CheR family methyltransferase [Aureimonas pseudogalii]MBB3999636.1 chemotaxis protein methyltransferase CheR [Aureimonas pseudogalii]
MTAAAAASRPAAADDGGLSPAAFERIAGIIRAEAGIHLDDAKASLVYARLVKRLKALGMTSFERYCDLVQSAAGAVERPLMVEALTTNYTFFLREPHHFEHFAETALPGLAARAAAGGRVRIWSAGCSMGHETYSIALRLLERMPDAGRHDIRILATDIDRNVLATARAGRYDAATLKVLTPADLDRGFRAAGPDLFEVRPELRELVAFHELNLLSDWPMRGTFDVVFFRNVAIYFDQGVREAIWLRMAERMPAGGWLYVGHSERITGEPAALFSHAANTTYRRLAG